MERWELFPVHDTQGRILRYCVVVLVMECCNCVGGVAGGMRATSRNIFRICLGEKKVSLHYVFFCCAILLVIHNRKYFIFAYDHSVQIEERKKVSCNFWPVWVSFAKFTYMLG